MDENAKKIPASHGINVEYQKISDRFRFAKYASILVLIIFILVMFTFFRDDITVENFRYFFRYIDTTNLEKDEADMIRYDSANVSDMKLYKGSIAFVDDSALQIYDLNGDNILTGVVRYANPNLVAEEKYLLVYNIGGNSYSIFNSLSKVFEGTLPFSVSSASMNASGMYIIVSKSQEYRSDVTLYSSEFSELYHWYSPDKFVMATDVSDNNRDFVIASVSTDEEGTSYAELIGCRVGTEQKTFDTRINDTVPLDVRYNDDGELILMTSTGVFFFDEDGQQTKFESFDGYIPTRTEIGKNYVYVSTNKNVVGSENTICLLSDSGDVLFEGVINGEITDFCVNDDAIFFLTERQIQMVPFFGGDIIVKDCETGGNRLISVDANRILLSFTEKTQIININDFFYN